MSAFGLLPFRFLRIDETRTLVVNEVGEFHHLTNEEFLQFVRHEFSSDSTAYLDLKAKHFLFDSDSLVPFELLATKYRTKKAFLDGFTSLHLFVVSLRCEHSCHYCQVSRVSIDRARYDMSGETARRALDLVFRSPAPRLKIELQGGEPLLHFERVRQIVLDARMRAEAENREIEFVVTTNLALLNDEMLAFFKEHDVFLSTSLDGPEALHNANRPRPGNDSHARALEGIRRVRETLGQDRVAALMTTTRGSLALPEAIVDEYARLGFTSIFLRPLSPYGFALRSVRATGYSMREFLQFYVRALDRILALNAGGTYLVETYAQLLLTRMLTPFATGYVDLQSPAGAGIGAVVYNYDGDVYASDESRMLAEMGDTRFRLGNVHRDCYESIFGGETLRRIVTASVAESIPGCADCAFLPWCGADPVHHYATTGDLVPRIPASDFHEKNFFIIRHLLSLYERDAATRRIFGSWIQDRPSRLEEVA
ncbi:MAG TPA: His-Xaa-Ser system radical SAM maturase HxsB [Thermoanaerobaculia bacterium]|nr:His-Xaa-Ser system radical SAM maturase HxsB [Thermoanaerobaculia bacterium]